MTEAKLFTGALRLFGILALLAIGVGMLLYSVLTGVSHSVSDQTALGWSDRLGTFEEVLALYPSRDCNAAAQALELLVAELGFSITPRQTRDVPVDSDDEKAWASVSGKLGKYIDKELSRSGNRGRAPKEDVAAWLQREKWTIDTVADRLATGEPPRWLRHLEHLHSAPLPNLLGHMHLQRVLAADALYRITLGDHATARNRLEAAWRLNESLATDPWLISQLIAMAGLRMQIGVLRRIDDAPAAWNDRLVSFRPRETVIRGLEIEAWMWNHVDKPINAMPVSSFQRAALRIAAPYVRLCAADASRRMRTELEKLRRLDYLCDRDLAAAGADLPVRIPAWNKLGGLMAPQFAGAIKRAARLEIDLELTSHILDWRAAHASDIVLPADRSGFERSAACPDDRWDYRLAEDKSVSITFSRELSWPDMPGFELPTRFKAGR